MAMRPAKFYPEVPSDLQGLGSDVHAFWDANPQLGQSPSGGLPSRQANRLFQQLTSKYYGQDYGAIGEMGTDPMLDEFLAAVPNADAYADENPGHSMAGDFIDAMREPHYNQDINALNNAEYDWDQPYGFDFSGTPASFDVDHENGVRWRNDISNSYPGSLTPNYDSEEMNLPAVVGPIAKTAGSYALPMLFSMLMRGGK